MFYQTVCSFETCLTLNTVQGGQERRDVTSCEHQGTFAVIAVVIVLVSGAEAGPVCDQAALLPRCTAVASQIQPE